MAEIWPEWDREESLNSRGFASSTRKGLVAVRQTTSGACHVQQQKQLV